ncbi:MAG: energy transducer TonB [Deltaproteobacteria bacterium]|nr:MAG: energy transducer TonB [Deltaproteobacteria bacterium]
MTSEQRQNRIITGFILLSLLLHLLLLLLPKDKLFPEEVPLEPVYVEVRPPQQQERELDLPIRKELEKPREKPAKRLAEKDQVVEKEMAPEGKDVEDREKIVRSPKPAPKAPPKEQVKPRKEVVEQKTEPDLELPFTPDGWRQKPEKKQPREVPDLQTLTQISPAALSKIESDWRRKYRADVARGDTVWMDSQQDLLHSFMRRFRTNIYNVWNYPGSAVQRRQQGTCLLRITIDRRGNISNVELLESSGYRILDNEAITAVREGATYGPLPRAYPHEELKIMAFFDYRLSGSASRSSRRRPGAIY